MGSSIGLILDDSMILNSIGHTNVTKDNLEYIISCATWSHLGWADTRSHYYKWFDIIPERDQSISEVQFILLNLKGLF